MKTPTYLLCSLFVLLVQPVLSKATPPPPQNPPPPGLTIDGIALLFFVAVLYILYLSNKIIKGR